MIIGVPVKEVPVQFASLNAVTEYVLVVAGFIEMLYGFAVIPVIETGVMPSVYVMFHGCAPVKITLRFEPAPAQMVAVPEMVAVGKGLTVTTGVPMKEVPVQLASLKAVNVYVVLEVGLTAIVYGFKVMPVMVTGVVPSVYVMLQGCAPVKATFKLVLAPGQIVATPESVEVGNGFTVTVGVPVKLTPVQFASFTAVTE